MNRRIPYDHWIILSLTVLLGMGFVVVYNASSHRFLFKQLVAAFIGLLLLYAMMRIRYQIFNRNLVAVLLALLSASLLVVPLVISDPIKGARRWIEINEYLRFQPSELAKIVLIILTAHFLASYHQTGKRNGPGKGLTIFYFSSAFTLITLVLLGRDMSTAALMAMIVLIMFFLGGLRAPLVVGTLTAGLLAFAVLISSEGYRADRIRVFLNPDADPQGAGYHILQSLTSIGSGGLSGEGFGSGAQKLDFLPEAHTDFIFSAIGHETGLVGCLIVLTFFIIFVFRSVRAGYHSDSIFGSFLGLGIASVIGLQAFLNMSVALSLCPTTGLPLPFISYGGSSILMMLFATGIILNISGSPREKQRKRTVKQKQGNPEISSKSPDIVIHAPGVVRPAYRQATLWEEVS